MTSHPLPGSARAALTDIEQVGPVDPTQEVGVTLLLRRRAELPRDLVQGRDSVDRDTFAASYGATEEDVTAVRETLTGAGLRVTAEDPRSRRVQAIGPLSVLQELFGAELTRVRSGSIEHRHRSGELQVPAELAGIVLAVLGLDDRPQARAQFRFAAAAAGSVSYTPPQLGTVYGFPAGTDGTGQTIAILEMGGGFAQSDLDTYFGGLKITPPQVTAVGVDGGANAPGQDPSGADGEVLLDIEVAGALAPKADIVVYFAPNTDQGFLDAVSQAVHASPTPAAVSISWGGPEGSWTAQTRSGLDSSLADAAALGITVCVAAGDGGSSDGQSDGRAHVDFPAASPHALACGGTSLRADPASGSVTSETVWNSGQGGGATGGGVSTAFDLPDWQQDAKVPARSGGGTGRGVPDVAGDADPATGYSVLVDGKAQVIGGTSAVAPLWAALVARLAQGAGKGLGLLQPMLYPVSDGFRDITSGSNGDYSAGPGWDACTGLGVPVGTALARMFTAS